MEWSLHDVGWLCTMINPTNLSQLYGDFPLGWKQFQDLFESPAAQGLKLTQYILIELIQGQSPSLAIRAATGAYHGKTLVSVDDSLPQKIDQEPGIWFMPDVFEAASALAPLASFISHLGGKSAFFSRVTLDEQLWGFLVGYSMKSRCFDPTELALFSLLTKTVTLLVENVQLRFGTAFRLSEALSLKTLSTALFESGSLKETLALIVDETVRLLHAQDALILLLEAGGEWFQVRGSIGNEIATSKLRRMSVKNSLNGTVVMTGEPLISLNTQTDPRANQARAARLNVHNVIIAPLKIRERTIGTIAVHNKIDGYFDQEDINVLRSFANQIAIAIDNAQLFSDLVIARNEIQQKARELQELLIQTIDIQEVERRRIAADIHDRVVSQIVGALYEVEGCIQLNHTSKDLAEKLQLLKQLLNEATEQIRRSIYNLWPATLDHMNLIPALHEMIKRQETITGIRHTIQVHGTPYQLRRDVQIAAYRIVQEAMNNAFQHGEASSIDASIRFNPRQLSIKIRDNGQGFDVQQVMQLPLACHYGLIVMRERAQSVGGSVVVKSQPGKGSLVTLEIPSEVAMKSNSLCEYVANSCADC
jgi:signal transduction histidine kinase